MSACMNLPRPLGDQGFVGFLLPPASRSWRAHSGLILTNEIKMQMIPKRGAEGRNCSRAIIQHCISRQTSRNTR